MRGLPLALLLLFLSFPLSAEEPFEKALQKGSFYLEAGNPSRAVMEFSKAVELRPADAEGYTFLGIAKAAAGDASGSAEAHRRAAERAPDRAAAHYNLAVALGREGRLEEALAAFNRSLLLESKNPAAYFNMGVLYLRMGKVRRARASFEKAALLSPASPFVHYNLAVAYEHGDSGRYREGWVPLKAIEHYGKALDVEPGNTMARFNLAVLLARLGRPGEALPHMKFLLDRYPDEVSLHRWTGVLYLESGKYFNALREFGLLDREGADPDLLRLKLDAYRGLRRFYLAHGDAEGALRQERAARAVETRLGMLEREPRVPSGEKPAGPQETPSKPSH